MEHGNPLRERLIDAGVELVMTDGSASLGLREIARRAGVSHGAPRRYFPTHHSLLSAIARRGFTDLAHRVAAAVDAVDSPRARLRALADAYLGYAWEHHGMFELMFRHDLLDSKTHEPAGETEAPEQPRLRESTLPLFAHLVGLIAQDREENAERGTGTSDEAVAPPAVTAAALWTNLYGIAELRARRSLQLALDAASPDGGDRLEPLVAAVLDAHLGRANP
ncbi:TetR family transcriptional regulator [Streptomyces sp. A0958]|uniref:TetR/AcrR family transcriptional regulator n=1 Tax=Streptomyces sp. A0958 TaxID=2563101 RepID=UPI00109EA6B5|nr:TetR/AcrR family transcriptional regulator [Streptomyces sp. A0958]THA71560.1 TetR family transcriptional regulator [Streptomyces sp. A0958]